jgi:hypothetical protein
VISRSRHRQLGRHPAPSFGAWKGGDEIRDDGELGCVMAGSRGEAGRDLTLDLDSVAVTLARSGSRLMGGAMILLVSPVGSGRAAASVGISIILARRHDRLC